MVAEFAHVPEDGDGSAAGGHGGEGAQPGAGRFAVGVERVVDDGHAIAAFEDLHAPRRQRLGPGEGSGGRWRVHAEGACTALP
jgi:hypothetical protein